MYVYVYVYVYMRIAQNFITLVDIALLGCSTQVFYLPTICILADLLCILTNSSMFFHNSPMLYGTYTV